MRYHLPVAAALVALAAGWCPAVDVAPAPKPEPSVASPEAYDDARFAKEIAVGGLFEVESSELAKQKGVSGPAREFADRMIADHGRMNQEFDQLAARKGWAVGKSLDAKHEKLHAELDALTGESFAKRYAAIQVQAHDEAISLLERASREGRDGELKDFAAKHLPHLREHREMAVRLPGADQRSSAVEGEASGGSLGGMVTEPPIGSGGYDDSRADRAATIEDHLELEQERSGAAALPGDEESHLREEARIDAEVDAAASGGYHHDHGMADAHYDTPDDAAATGGSSSGSIGSDGSPGVDASDIETGDIPVTDPGSPRDPSRDAPAATDRAGGADPSAGGDAADATVGNEDEPAPPRL